MSSRKKPRGQGSVRAEPGGLEEAYFGGSSYDYKTIQLCSQVEEAVSMALLSSADPVMRDLHVVGVEPVRGSALMRVLVAIETEEAIDVERISEKLDNARGYLRGEVAKAINRKRVPGLELVLVPWTEETDDEIAP